LLQALLQANFKSVEYNKGYKAKGLKEKQVNLLQFIGRNIKEFRMEAYLEAYLLRNPNIIHELSGFENGLSNDYHYEILNQVSTYIAGGAIDIVCLYKKKVIDLWLKIGATVFELKKGIIDPFFVEQLVRYIEWTSRLMPGVKKEMIKGILIGRDFGNQYDKRENLIKKINELKELYILEAYTYSIQNNLVIFEKLEN